jgi:phenylpropionate dioxygenase-like ring-hydroxylating dioxygenase large terminal subunit
VFASLAESGAEFEDFLAGVKSSLDNFCDRAPEGTVSVAGGVFRVVQRSNWKIFFENLYILYVVNITFLIFFVK